MKYPWTARSHCAAPGTDVISSTGHSKQIELPSEGAYQLVVQGAHCTAPDFVGAPDESAAKVPGLQIWHESICPTSDIEYPSGHAAHASSCEVAPTAIPVRPDGHEMHAPTTQEAQFAPSDVQFPYWPRGHAEGQTADWSASKNRFAGSPPPSGTMKESLKVTSAREL